LDLSKSAENSGGQVMTAAAKPDFLSPLQSSLQREQQRQKEALIVDLSDEVPVYVAPKAIRRMLS
jgi:hypothetical protein